MKKNNLRRLWSSLSFVLVVLVVLGVGGSYYFYQKYSAIKVNPNLEVKKEVDALISIVGELIELPKGEVPTVATILDKEKLKGQLFFAAGENGDKLLAYNVAMKAILYRPSTNKIINVAPIAINQPSTSVQPGASVSAPLK